MSNFSRIIVVGWGQFPVDMLRYDECWPEAGEDVAAIQLDCTDKRANETRRAVRLLSRRHTPTVARWSSFNWAVVSHDSSGYEREREEIDALLSTMLPRGAQS